MKKNLQEYALIAEIVSGLAVVITLVVLIASIQRNTEVTKASMFVEMQRGFDSLELMALEDPDLNHVYEALLNSMTSGLDEQDRMLVNRLIVSTARNYDIAFAMRNSDLLGENEWERASRYLCTNHSRAISAGGEDLFLGLMSINLQDHVKETCAD